MTYTEDQYNQVLIDTAAQLQAKNAELATVTAQRDGLSAIIAQAKSLHAQGNMTALLAMFTEAEKSEAQKQLDTAKSCFDAAQKNYEEAQAKIAAQ